MCLLPLEPREPTLPLLGFELTLLEASAALIGLLLAWTGRGRLLALARRPPAPLVFVTLLALAHLLAALAAPTHADLAVKFALRMAALAGYAWLVAAAPAGHRAALAALAAVACVLSALALAEALGLRALDPLLNRFREMPFNVAGSRRASAFTEYPNLAAAFLLYGLVAGAGLPPVRPVRWAGAADPHRRAAGRAACSSPTRAARSSPTALGLLGWRGRCPAHAARRRGACARAAACWACCAASFAWAGEIFRLRLASEGTSRWYLARYEPAETRAPPAAGRAAHDDGPRHQHRAEGLDRARRRSTSRTTGGTWTGSCWRKASARASRATSGPGRARCWRRTCGRRDSRAGCCWSGTWSTSTRPGSAARACPARGAGGDQRASARPGAGAVLRRRRCRRRLAAGPLGAVAPRARDVARTAADSAWAPTTSAGSTGPAPGAPSGTRGCSRTTSTWRPPPPPERSGLVALCGTLAASALASARAAWRAPRRVAGGRGRLRAGGGDRGARPRRLPARVHRALPGARDRRGDVRGALRGGAP